MDKNELTRTIKAVESEYRFRHSCSMADMAVSLARCHGIDEDTVWMTAMLHDIAKEYSPEEMRAVAERYGYTISELSLRYPANMHAEIGALIAEHEFGLRDRNAINAIRYHVSARPDMSTFEKIIYFSDYAEATRPNYAMTQYLYRIARTDLDLAILRGVRSVLEYQISHQLNRDVCELLSNALDFLLEERMKKKSGNDNSLDISSVMLTDDEFDAALEVIRRNGLPLKSVKNIRDLGGFRAADGRVVRKGGILRSAALSSLSAEDAEYLKNTAGLSLVIDLRTEEEVRRSPDVSIPGVRYENIPLSETLRTERMNTLANLYGKSQTESERIWYLSEYARIDEVRRMYYNISVDQRSRDAVRKVFQLILEEEGTVLFHCTSGKDRTGILSALFLYALGCSKQDIIIDYNASAAVYMAVVESLRADLMEQGYSSELQAGVQTILGVVPEVIAAGFYYIDSNYGSNRELLMEQIGVDHRQLQALKEKFLQ